MQTKSIVQASANVIRIVSLQKGDIYKRYESSSFGDDKVTFGIVRDVVNNGDNTFIEATEFEVSYSEMKAKTKIFSGEKDISIFPASIEEIEEDFTCCRDKVIKDIAENENKIVELRKALVTTEALLSGELQKELRTPDFKEMTQPEFNAKKIASQNNTEF